MFIKFRIYSLPRPPQSRGAAAGAAAAAGTAGSSSFCQLCQLQARKKLISLRLFLTCEKCVRLVRAARELAVIYYFRARPFVAVSFQ